MTFLLCEAEMRLKDNALIKLNKLIKWTDIKEKMGDLGRSGYGPEAYDPLSMLKALILQAWHNLSDRGLEEALKVRMDFMAMTGFSDVPDETTICRFRNLLIKRGLMDELLLSINEQIDGHGLKVKASQGAIIDATLIASAARPKQEITMKEDRKEEEVEYQMEGNSLSKDEDARWLKKGKKSHFGYKGFAVVDQEDGYIKNIHVTPANKSEVKEFAEILPKVKVKGRFYADKGYASKENKELLRSHGIKNGIMEKAKVNKPLTAMQKRFNKLISQVRYKVERCFGTLKRKFRFDRASYLSTTKVHAQMVFKAIAHNLLKAINMVMKLPQNPLIV